MNVLGLNFPEFKSLVGKHRIYYYEGSNYFDFHFLVDGMFVKTTVMKQNIENLERFFSDKIFYGAMRLTFNIPVPTDNPFSVVTEGIKSDIQVIPDVPQDTELKNKDGQREGVED